MSLPIERTDPATALESEANHLLAVLRQNPDFRKLEVIQSSLAAIQEVYGNNKNEGAPRKAEGFFDVPAEPQQVRGTNQIKTPRANSLTTKVVIVASELLEATGKRLTSADLVHELPKRGIPIDGPKPQSKVASILTHHPAFDNAADSRGRGYGLAVWATNGHTNTVVGASAGLVASSPSNVRTGAGDGEFLNGEGHKIGLPNEQAADPLSESAA